MHMSLSSLSFWRKIIFVGVIALVALGLAISGNALAGSSASAPATHALQGEATPAPTGAGTEEGGALPATGSITSTVEFVNHSEFPILQGPFESPEDVTKACLSCHTDAAQDIMHTTHWTWEFVNETTGQTLGKKHVINNFCINPQSNEPRCTSCHVGYGWKDKDFDFTVEEKVDCLVCHDTTGTYKKFPAGAGYPVSEPKEFPPGSGKMWNPPDLVEIAQNVGASSRETCGACHFYGGGGNEVKHGDLDNSLVNPPYELDVHMSPEGQDFTCTNCHTTENHDISGSRYSWDPEQWAGCESCHTDHPHKLATLNQHTQKIACTTCHIPEFARGGIPTKMHWDWSKAGQMDENGKPYTEEGEDGWEYNSLKGEFRWEENVVPYYAWFNGQMLYTLAEDTIDPNGVVSINKPLGSVNDSTAKIWPFKHFTGRQPYDSGLNRLVIPHLFGKDDTAYWKNFDWGKAIKTGMEYAGLEYSGQYGFVDTEMYWPIAHMVAPAKDALHCTDCHTAEGGRLDFAALGYSDEDVTRLTHFPPEILSEEAATFQTDYTPESCRECHEDEYNQWTESRHGEVGTGCAACHKQEAPGEHPAVPLSMGKEAEICGDCHIQEYEDWSASKHGEVDITCVACHNPHTQHQRLVDDNQTTCENCHREEADDILHSTHYAANLTCLDCHKNTHENTGHTFNIGTDTCVSCHGDTIHTAAAILNGEPLSTTLVAPETVPPEKTTEELAEEQAAYAGIHATPPAAINIVAGIILALGFVWLFFANDNNKS